MPFVSHLFVFYLFDAEGTASKSFTVNPKTYPKPALDEYG
jgi:hypothetical protein